MEGIQTILNQFNFFLLVVARMTGIFAFTPFWGSRNIPGQVKIGLSFIFAFIIFPLVAKPQIVLPNSFLTYFLYLIAELIVGLIIGYIAMLILMAIQFAGGLIDMQMGLSIVSVFDPQSSMSMPLVGQFKYILAMLLFLALDGHHQIVIALFNSYQAIPLLEFHYSGSFINYLFYLVEQMFITAFCLSAPIVGILFITDVVLAIMTRTVPQLNIFVVGFPIKIAVGLILLIMVMPLYFIVLSGIFNKMIESIIIVLRNLH